MVLVSGNGNVTLSEKRETSWCLSRFSLLFNKIEALLNDLYVRRGRELALSVALGNARNSEAIHKCTEKHKIYFAYSLSLQQLKEILAFDRFFIMTFV